MPTPKQEKVIKLLLENLGKPNNTKTLGELLLEAGYAQSVADNPFLVLESEAVKDGLQEFVKDMEKKRKNALKEITDAKLKETSAKDAASIVDTLTKNIQLLSGKATENTDVNLKSAKEMTEEEVNEFLKAKLNGSTERSK